MEFIADEKGERLDRFLASRAKVRSRSEWEKAIRNGAIAVNGRVHLKPSYSVKKSDRIVVLEAIIARSRAEFVPDAEPELPLKKVYEDRDIVVVDKPAGMLTHPTPQEPRHTLVNALVARYPELVGVGENRFRPGIVHRLDRDTSGLIVVARNQDAFQFMKRQFLDHKVTKQYLALVYGVPKEREGKIGYAIRPSTQNRLKKIAVTEANADTGKSVRAAETRYKVSKTFGDRFALLEVMPKTGRTHQIRVHLAAIGHPVVGDRLYGRGDPAKSDGASDRGASKRRGAGGKGLSIPRQFLHAAKLTFTAPSGELLAFEAEIPADLRQALKKL